MKRPRTEFAEKYRRFSKALIAVGGGAGADTSLGLESEIVARANPYTDDLSGGLPVQLLFQGKALSDNQIDIFARDASGEVSHSQLRTDAQGRAVVPVTPGPDYLLDSVVMAPAPASEFERDPVWLSFWASLTFRVPAADEGEAQ